MTWTLSYHPEVEQDLISLGRAESKAILKVIENNLIQGQPDKVGQSLASDLCGYQRVHAGQTRIIYRVDGAQIHVLMIAVGTPRHHE